MKTGSPKATGGGGISKDQPPAKHYSDVEEVNEESDEDDEEAVLETSQNGRWQKINQMVSIRQERSMFLISAHQTTAHQGCPRY